MVLWAWTPTEVQCCMGWESELTSWLKGRDKVPRRGGRALCALLSRQAKPETISTTETEHVPRSLSLGRRLLRPIDRHSPLNSQIDWDQMVSLKMWPTAMIGELNV